MYVRPTSTLLLGGTLTPAIRAIRYLALTLLVAGVLADDEHRAVAADDLALLAHRLDRRSYLHGPFPRVWPGDALWLPREQPLLRHGWRARRGIAHARTVEDSKGVPPPSGPERFRRTNPRRGAADRVGVGTGKRQAPLARARRRPRARASGCGGRRRSRRR